MGRLRTKCVPLALLVNALAAIIFFSPPMASYPVLDDVDDSDSYSAPGRPMHMHCVGKRLLVDAGTRELGDVSGTDAIPLMVVPLMLDLVDFRAMMCNITVPIRLLVLVQNGQDAALSSYLTDIEALYGWSGRLIVRRHPENIGYSAAINIGLRLALSRTREEVPFVYLTNSDVTFSPEHLPNMLRDVYAMTANDSARMDALAAEVAGEPSDYSPVSRPARVLRSKPDDKILSTSQLLPDRIRYSPLNERRKAFSQHYGYFCADYRQACFSSGIVTRLALSTVGLFDENLYPCYLEDIDYFSRAKLLGFKQRRVLYGTFVHRSKLNIRRSMKFNSVDALWFRRAKRLEANSIYSTPKWGHPYGNNGGYREPFGGRLPVDVWVKDEARIQRIREFGHAASKAVPELRYNFSLLYPYLKDG